MLVGPLWTAGTMKKYTNTILNMYVDTLDFIFFSHSGHLKNLAKAKAKRRLA